MSSDEQVKLNVDEKAECIVKAKITTETEDDEKPDIRGDRGNIAFLLLLSLMQAIPYGLVSAIPMILQKRGASYEQQAQFSMAFWPTSIRLLWAPLVDSCFSKKFGRRKSWIVPVQYVVGLTMITMSFYIDYWLGDAKTETNITMLILMFLILSFMSATQDTIVDGWLLTMLKKRNLGYTPMCSWTGFSIGSYFGYALLVSLESPHFCNTYLRSVPQDEGIWSVSGW